MMTTSNMTGPDHGERAARKTERLRWGVKGALFTLGLGTGAYIGMSIARHGFDVGAPMSREIAIAFAVAYAVALTVGTLLLRNNLDEHEAFRTYRAAAVAGTGLLVVYPLWFLLWKGGLLVEPIHWLLFAGYVLSFLGAALYYRFR